MSPVAGAPPPGPRPGAVERVVRAIDVASTAAGWFAGWLIVPMTFAMVYEVTARYLFNAPTRWAGTVTYMLYGSQFMLAAAYTLLKGGHIRTDVFYERWPAKTRAAVDTIGYVLLFFPGMLFVLYAGSVEAWQSWTIGERAGMFRLWALKAVIPLTAALLLLQGLAELIRCVRVLRGGAR